MIVHLDLITDPETGLVTVVKSPGHVGWRYRPKPGMTETEIKAAAIKSIRVHIGRNLRFVWWGIGEPGVAS